MMMIYEKRREFRNVAVRLDLNLPAVASVTVKSCDSTVNRIIDVVVVVLKTPPYDQLEVCLWRRKLA